MKIDLPTDTQAIAEGCYFSDAKAAAALGWIERNLKVRLYQWQRRLLFNYFGWRNKEGGYRFRTVSVWIPKKNGKTFCMSIILAYKLFELKNCNLYSVAYTAKQAGLCMDSTISLLKNSPTLSPLIELGKVRCYSSPYRREIINDVCGTKYAALADNENAADGLIGKVLIVDELHRMKNRLYDVAVGCLKNIPQSLQLIISTAGDGNKVHRSFEQYTYAQKVQCGEIADTSLLPVIYECADVVTKPDEIYDINRMLAANPVLMEDETKRADAIKDAAKAKILRNDLWWKRFVLNQWVASDGEIFIAPEIYATAEIPAPPKDFQLMPCYVGIDRSGGQWDFTGISFLFRLADGRLFESHYAFTSEDRITEIEDRDDMRYGQYVAAGELVAMPSTAVVDEWLTDWIVAKLKTLKVKSIAADPYGAAYIAETLAGAGYKIVHVQQSNNRLLSPVIADYAERVRQGRIVHTANRLYDWQLSNAMRLTTAKDTIKIVKRGSNRQGQGGNGKIDSVDAVLNALAVLRADEITKGTGGIIVG